MKHDNGVRSRIRRTRQTFTIVTIISFVTVIAASSSQRILSQTGAKGGDPQRGKELFEKRCGGCHSLEKDKEGPRLGNVFGRRAGTIPTFKYSESLKSAQVVWDETL